MIRTRFFLLILFIFVIISSGLCEYSVNIIEQTDSRVRLAVQFPLPAISAAQSGDSGYSDITCANWPVTRFANDRQLPYTAELLHLAGKHAAGILVSSETTRIKTVPPRPYSNDIPTGIDADTNPLPVLKQSDAPVVPDDLSFALRYTGDLGGSCLWSLELYPYHYDAGAGELVVTTAMVIEITVTPGDDRTPLTQPEAEQLNRLGLVTHSKTREKKNGTTILSKTTAAQEGKWKIIIEKDGFYRVTGKDLSAAGLKLLDIDIKTLRLTNDGKETPIYVQGWKDGQFNKDDYFLFWAEYSRQNITTSATDLYKDPYSPANVYWLSWGGQKGIWMGEEQGLVNLDPNEQYNSPYSFNETIHIEQDSYFDRLSMVQTDSIRDHWFFDGGIKAGRREDYNFKLYHPDPQSTLGVSCRLLLCGRTSLDTIPHDITCYLNKNYLGAAQWWQQDYYDLVSDTRQSITGADLNDGDNQLTIVNNIDAKEFDFVMLNWFEVSYPRLYKAQEDFLKFTIPPDNTTGNYVFRISNFADDKIEVYKLGQNKIVGGTVTGYPAFGDSTLYQISFTDYISSANTEYIAISPDSMLKPLAIVPDEPTLLKSTNLSADYLLISHHRFVDMPEVQQLLELRQAQGYHTLLVDIQDIYDEFNYGKPGPFGLKRFLKWAYDNWQAPQLKYVLLLGDGSYVRYSTEADTLDLVPAYMRQTYNFGAAASDHWYALLDGDNEIADIHIGRIPARTPEEAGSFIAKMIDYEKTPAGGAWRNRILYLAGNGQVFRDQGEILADKVPLKFDARKLYTIRDESGFSDPFFGGTIDLLDYFNDGCAVMTFHGHGGGAIWADNGLLRIEDCRQIYNQGRLPLILSMTCYTGAFESPSGEALADALLFAQDTGVIGFLGASGFGWTQNDYYLQTEIFNYLYNNPGKTLGEIVDAGKTLYFAKHKYLQTITQLNQYHLFGDPATPMILPTTETGVKINTQTPQSGETLRVNCQIPFSDGLAEFALNDSSRRQLNVRSMTITGNECSAEFTLPDPFPSQSGSIRFYAGNSIGTQQAHGAVVFSLTGIVFDSATVVHSDKDSLNFGIKVSSRFPVKSVYCLVMNDTLALAPTRGNWYTCVNNWKLHYSSYELEYSFIAESEDGTIYSSTDFIYFMKKGPDLTCDKNSIRITGDNYIYLEAKIINNGDTEANQIPVLLQLKTGSGWTDIGAHTINITAFSTATVRQPLSLPPGAATLQIRIDPDYQHKDVNRSNNDVTVDLTISSVNYDPLRGLYYGDTIIDTLAVDSVLALWMPAEATAQNRVVTLKRVAAPVINEQPDFTFIENVPVYDLALSNGVVSLLKPAQVIFTLPERVTVNLDSSAAAFDVYTLSPGLQKWVKCNGVRSGNCITAQVTVPGQLAVIQSVDILPPKVDVSVNGQPYAYDRYISPEPVFCINLQDINGVNITSPIFQVMLDGRQLERSELSAPDSVVNANFVSFTFEPKLATGQHTLHISCIDCNGNVYNSEEYVFKTASEFAIKLLGNYPNPFTESTIIGYMLTFPVQEIKVKIYTASGRLIREINPRDISEDPNPYSADYHEVFWDGLDEEGDEIANGVYFYRITAVSGSKTLHETGKMAKLK
ncbi:MAG TPA: C25 family cysteine peptidase [bacterium]|nr:C25 family cysteine peptidase [bacterium]HPN44282.1 C25 family cysteine peptidase [bacterium]